MALGLAIARMKVLALCRYGPQGASSRLRTLQFLPELKQRGIEVTVDALLDDQYLQRLYSNRRPSRRAVAGAYVRRVHALLGSKRFDAVWLEKEAFPWLPMLVEKPLLRRPYLVDFDDAIFHRYDAHASALVRRALSSKLDAVMRRAAVVTAGNRYLAERARSAGAQDVRIIPTCVDLQRYQVAAVSPSEFVVGWIGTPATAKFLVTVRSVLQRLHAQGGFIFRFVGAPRSLDLGVPFEAVPWTAATEVQELQRFSCGLMPLIDAPFERGKSGYKLIQYMACGVPSVASPVGANRDIVVDGETGLLAATEDDWFAAINRLRLQPQWARQLGEAGRQRVAERYTTAVNVDGLADALRATVASEA